MNKHMPSDLNNSLNSILEADTNPFPNPKDNNFILIDKIPKSNLIFGDIVVFNKANNDSNNIVIDSFTFLQSKLELIKIVSFCIVSILQEFFESIFYQLFTLLADIYKIICNLPNTCSKLTASLEEIILNLLDAKNREFWWFECKINLQDYLNKLENLVGLVWKQVRCFYLMGIVGFFSLFLVIAGTAQSNTDLLPDKNESVFYNFVEKQSVNIEQKTDLEPSVKVQKLATSSTPKAETEAKSYSGNQNISLVKVEKPQEIQEFAQLYGVSPETIKYNNAIEGDTIDQGKDLKVPWVDAYVYENDKEIKISELARIYQVEEESLKKLNQNLLNQDQDKFDKDAKVLIPIKNSAKFANIKELEKKEAQKKIVTSKSKTSQKTVDVYKGKIAIPDTSQGFMNPTTGYITRCTRGHGYPACDIQDYRSKKGGNVPIVAVKDGVVVKGG